MLLYEKIVNGVKQGIFGTLGKVPSEEDQHVIYKDKNGVIITDEVKYGDRFRDDKEQGMNREQDGKNVTVWIGNTMVIPPKGQVGPTPVLESIRFEAAPAKVEYFVGEALSLAGAKIIATFDILPEQDVTSACTFEPSNGHVFTEAEIGKVNLVASYAGKTASVELTVKEVVQLKVYSGISDTLPTGVAGLTAKVETKAALLDAEGYEITLSPNNQFSVFAVDKGLEVKLTNWEKPGLGDYTFGEIAATDQRIYYLNGPDDVNPDPYPGGDGTPETTVLRFTAV